jgi:hypothetical protein
MSRAVLYCNNIAGKKDPGAVLNCSNVARIAVLFPILVQSAKSKPANNSYK